MEDIYDFLAKGGVLIVPILLCSVTALALFLERTWALQRTRVLPRRFMELVMQLVTEGKASEAETLCASSGSSAAEVALAGLRHRGRRRQVLRESMEEVGRRELALLSRYIGGLGTIASISPLLGLLGTVAGMIRVFKLVVDEVSARGVVNPGALANGIWEALITTAAGLAVAIPTYIAFRFLESRIDRVAIELEHFASRLLDELEDPGEPADRPSEGEPRPADAAA